MNYSDKLRDPRWQRKRLEVLGKVNFKCQECGNKTMELHVHHLEYIAGLEPWEYPDRFYRAVCAACHSKIHLKDGKPSVINNGETDFSNALKNLCNMAVSNKDDFDYIRKFVKEELFELLKSEPIEGNAVLLTRILSKPFDDDSYIKYNLKKNTDVFINSLLYIIARHYIETGECDNAK